MVLAYLLVAVYTNSQNWIRLHKIGQRDRKISIFLFDFVKSDLILAVHLNAGLVVVEAACVSQLLAF